MAEGTGFEPANAFTLLAFQASSFDRSDTLPYFVILANRTTLVNYENILHTKITQPKYINILHKKGRLITHVLQQP